MKRKNEMIRGLKWVACVVASVAAMFTTSTAQAQLGRAAGIPELMNPEYLSRDVIIFVEGLDLDDAQKIIVESLYDDYVRQFEAGKQTLHDDLVEIKDRVQEQSAEDEILDLIFQPFETWRTNRVRVGEEFLQNVQLILSAQQLNQWDSFLRRLTREKLLYKGLFAGESLNIFNVIRDMRLPRDVARAIEPLLESYSIELNEALQAREEAFDQSQGEVIDILATEHIERTVDLVKSQTDARVRIRRVNDHYTQEIAAILPPQLSDQFIELTRLRAYPRIYTKTRADKMYEAALELSDLDAETRKDVTTLYEDFRLRVSELNERLCKGLVQWEPRSEINKAEIYVARTTTDEIPAREQDPTRQLFMERTGMVRDSIYELRTVLSEDQFALLPGSEMYAKREAPKPRDADAIVAEKLTVQEELEKIRRDWDRSRGQRAANRAKGKGKKDD